MKLNNSKTTLLLILDGWGIAPFSEGNAIALAKTPFMDSLYKNYPHTLLTAHGKKVGLPDDQDGNSEAGHMNISAGWVVKQDTIYISESIKDGTFFKNTAFLETLKHVKKYKTKVHLIGLLSNGESPHSNPQHLYAFLKLMHQEGIKKVFLHLFTDGRDSSRFSAIKLLPQLKDHFYNSEKIASMMGRFYAMDRKKKWSRTEKAYHAIVNGEGIIVSSPEEAIAKAYNRGESDEYLLPSIISDKKKNPLALVEDNDAVFFFNLRSDRARQLTKAFTQKDFNKKNKGSFLRKRFPKNIRFCALTDFGPDLPHIFTAYPSRNIMSALPAVLKDRKQIYLAESEKYAHLTYFFNGGYADPMYGEERIHVSSPDVARYEETPQMNTPQLIKTFLKILKNRPDFIAMNFCNGDMIGHTGNLEAAIKAVEYVDKAVKQTVEAVIKLKGRVLITADHGNIEEMINLKTGEVDTEHSVNPVPLIIVDDKFKGKKKKMPSGILADIAPTVLSLMGIPTPREMTGKNLML